MRWLGNVCVTLYMCCLVNVVTTFVPGGPLLGLLAGHLAMLVVFVLMTAALVLRQAMQVELPRRLRLVYRALSRRTLVAGLCAGAALVAVVLYDGLANNWSEASPRSLFATAGVIAAMSALNLYALQAFIDRNAVVASNNGA